MSLKLSRNKVNYLTKLIVEYIQTNDEVDYSSDLPELRIKIFRLIMDELRFFEKIEETAKEKIRSQKKNIPQGSQDWEILFRKYCAEELSKSAKIWD
jgi:hypothetical protein